MSDLSVLLRSILPDARTEVVPIVAEPEVKLELLEDLCFRRPLTELEVNAAWESPPYWAFCWASGRALAQFIGQNPKLFQGKTVIDLGAGSGVVGIAAAKVGASVICCDLDPDALTAVRSNSLLNGIHCEPTDGYPAAGAIALSKSLDATPRADILVAADVLYDPENLPLLDLFTDKALEVWVGDSRIRNFNHARFTKVDEIASVTLPDLDELEIHRRVSIYYSGPGN